MARRVFIFGLALLLGACAADRSQMSLHPEAVNIGTTHEIFAVSNRVETGEGVFTADRGSELAFLRADVSVPPNRDPGSTKANFRNPNPERHFVVAAQDRLPNETAFKRELRDRLRQLPVEERETTLFVHGYNTSHAEGLYRLTQVQHDLEPPGVPVLFSWPSAARLVGYAYDHDSMIFSRDALQETLFTLTSVAPKRILLVAHSMGAMLSMETLRQIETERPGWSQRNLAGVVLIAPDIDIDVFLSQIQRFKPLPQPFLIFVSDQDKALEVSGLINGRPQRLGRTKDIEALREYPILVIDISEFADGRNADHFTVGTSPELMDFLTSPELIEVFESQSFDSGTISASGQLVHSSAKQAEKAIQWILFPDAGEN